MEISILPQQLSGIYDISLFLINPRKLQQTETHEAVMSGELSIEDEESLNLTQGHSRTTAERFYLKRKMSKAATNATFAHTKLYGEAKVPHLPPILTDSQEEFEPEQEGKNIL